MGGTVGRSVKYTADTVGGQQIDNWGKRWCPKRGVYWHFHRRMPPNDTADSGAVAANFLCAHAVV